jgi:sigma-70-like protein
VADVRELPEDQRAALLLTEMGDLSHAQVAEILDCDGARVKALVFRARSRLIARREARETPCDQIREQLATLRGGALRRTDLRLHLRDCPGCRAYREEIRRQRQMLAAALPVAPTAALKSSVLAGAGLGGSAGGAAGLAGALGGATVAKVAIAGALAGGGLVAGDAVVGSDHPTPARPGPAQAAPETDGPAPAGGVPAASPAPARSSEGASGRGGSMPARARGGEPGTAPRGAVRARGRGPIAAPPGSTPVRRGPPEKAGVPRSAKPHEAGKGQKAKRKASQPERSDGRGLPKAEKGVKAPKGERAEPPAPKANENGRGTAVRRRTAGSGTPSAGRTAGSLDESPARAGTVVAGPGSGGLASGKPNGAPGLD